MTVRQRAGMEFGRPGGRTPCFIEGVMRLMLAGPLVAMR
jgi:hypothetical protein